MATTRRRPKAAEKFLNRELSQVEWNARVLARAADTTLPVLERVRNCAFYSSNLDEFFAIRVAGLLAPRRSTPSWRRAFTTTSIRS